MARSWGERAEPVFETWARFIVAHPLRVLLPSLAITFFAIAGLVWLRVDVTFESFLEQDDPVLIAYEKFADTFGRDERIVISADPGVAAGPAGVFARRFLERLRDFHRALEERVPHLEELTSLVNARDTRAEGDTLIVEEFLDPWPEDDAAIARLRERAFDNPLFQGSLLSADASATALSLELQLHSTPKGVVDELAGFDDEGAGSAGKTAAGAATPTLLSGAEIEESVAAVQQVIAEFQRPDFVLYSAGTPILISPTS